MTAIIFGASGQDGYYLSKLLKEQGINVIEWSRSTSHNQFDVSDYASVSRIISILQPQYVFHFAANSSTKHEAFFENHATICNGTNNILESVKNFSAHSKVFISGSALQFENKGKPIKETDRFEARDAYSVCRIQSVYAARYYRSLGLKTYVGYFFNHDSPKRGQRHVSKLIADAARNVKAGSSAKIEIGDTTVKKEWTYAGDMVKAVWALVQQTSISEAVLGSGIAHSIEEYLEACFSLVGKNWEDYVTTKPGFKAEYEILVSNPETIFSLGWRPEIDIKNLAKMMLEQ